MKVRTIKDLLQDLANLNPKNKRMQYAKNMYQLLLMKNVPNVMEKVCLRMVGMSMFVKDVMVIKN